MLIVTAQAVIRGGFVLLCEHSICWSYLLTQWWETQQMFRTDAQLSPSVGTKWTHFAFFKTLMPNDFCKFDLQQDCRGEDGLHRSSDTPDSEISAPASGDRFKNWCQNRTQTRVSIWARIGESLPRVNLFRYPRIRRFGERQVKNRSSPCGVTPCHTDNRRLLQRFPASPFGISKMRRGIIKAQWKTGRKTAIQRTSRL